MPIKLDVWQSQLLCPVKIVEHNVYLTLDQIVQDMWKDWEEWRKHRGSIKLHQKKGKDASRHVTAAENSRRSIDMYEVDMASSSLAYTATLEPLDLGPISDNSSIPHLSPQAPQQDLSGSSRADIDLVELARPYLPSFRDQFFVIDDLRIPLPSVRNNRSAVNDRFAKVRGLVP
jgi:hypothetical protein